MDKSKIIETVCSVCGMQYGTKKNKGVIGFWRGNCDICGRIDIPVADAAHDYGIYSNKSIENFDKIQDLL